MDRTLTLRDRQNYVNGVQLSDLEELQKSGQELYRKKQYEAALERFSLVRNMTVSSSFGSQCIEGYQERCGATSHCI